MLLAAQGERHGLRMGAIHYFTKPWAPGVVIRVMPMSSAPA